VPSRRVSPAPTASRFRKGTTTFGPVGRISWTLVIVVLPIFVVVFGGIAGILFFVAWCGGIAPLALRDIWKKDWVYVPGQRSGPPPSLVSYDGTPLPTLEQYVANQAKPNDA
jgi:hypothetical protein